MFPLRLLTTTSSNKDALQNPFCGCFNIIMWNVLIRLAMRWCARFWFLLSVVVAWIFNWPGVWWVWTKIGHQCWILTYFSSSNYCTLKVSKSGSSKSSAVCWSIWKLQKCFRDLFVSASSLTLLISGLRHPRHGHLHSLFKTGYTYSTPTAPTGAWGAGAAASPAALEAQGFQAPPARSGSASPPHSLFHRARRQRSRGGVLPCSARRGRPPSTWLTARANLGQEKITSIAPISASTTLGDNKKCIAAPHSWRSRRARWSCSHHCPIRSPSECCAHTAREVAAQESLVLENRSLHAMKAAY